MIVPIEIGRWGNIARAIVLYDEKTKKIRGMKIVSIEEILKEVRYGHLLFSFEINSFMKTVSVSIKQNYEWVFTVRTQQELKEIDQKIKKYFGFSFELNPEMQFIRKNARDIDVVTNIIPL